MTDPISAASPAEQPASNQGQLKIFLGYAPGVGKRLAMARGALGRHKAGQSVVAAILHGREEPDLARLLAEFEPAIAPDERARGHSPSPFDLDAVHTLEPDLILADDLGRSNPPAARHAFRYQNVLELLAAGVDVFAALNVHQLESLSDDVEQILGVKVRSTVPDSLLDNAGEIEVVDLPVDELAQRLDSDQIATLGELHNTVESFYRPGNLAALRELALRQGAEYIDIDLRAYMRSHSITGPWPATERLLVCVSPSPLSGRLVRKARRMASQLQADWTALYVEAPSDGRLGEAEKRRVTDSLQLAERLGGTSLTLPGESVSDAIIEYAQKHNITKIIAGKPLRRAWIDMVRPSLVDRIVQKSDDIDVYVISSEARGADSLGHDTTEQSNRASEDRLIKYLWSVATVGAATLLALPLRPLIEPTNLVMLYLLVTVGTALRIGRGPAMLSSFLGVLAFDLVFVPPYYRIVVADSEFLLTFVALLSVGVIISNLAARSREQAHAARRRATQTTVLYELSTELASASGAAEISRAVVEHIQQVMNARAALLVPGNEGMQVLYASGGISFGQEEDDVAAWVWQHGSPAGRGTDTYSEAAALYVPLNTSRRSGGVLAVQFVDGSSALSPEREQLIRSFASQAALALERASLAHEAKETELLERTKRLQEALLDSVSHDLRTPLVSIMGALSSLKDDATVLPEQTKHELVEMSYEEVMRMNRLISNLLEMTELESGSIHIRREACDLEDLVGVALEQLQPRMSDRPLSLDVPSYLPTIEADFTLMVQVLVNLIDNADKYSDPGKPITIQARDQNNHVEIDVRDVGPGIPTQDLPHIFEKFYRTSASPGPSGTGLGLSICKGLVEAHGGELEASNAPSGGSVFSIRLPKQHATLD